MHHTRLTRSEHTVPGNVLVISPFGVKPNGKDGASDFDRLYDHVIKPTIADLGMGPTRADSIYGPATVFDVVWRAIQQAELLVVDFTGRNANVALEYMAGRLLGKRMVFLSQNLEDVPSDVQGLRCIPYGEDFYEMEAMRAELKEQLEAVRQEPAQEMALIPMATGGSIPVTAQVVSVSREIAVVRADDGAHGVLSGEDVDWGRIIPDMSRRFKVGDRVDGAFEVGPNGGMKYTLLTGPDPWKALATTHPVGSTSTGIVHSSRDAGVFVQVGGGINGLIPRSMLPAGPAFTPGTEIEIRVVDLQPQRRKITLAPVGAAPAPPAPSADSAFPVGMRLEGEVVKVAPEGEGGFILLTVAGRTRPVFLHCSKMTAELRGDLNSGGVERGELLDLEVVATDPARDRVLVRDLPDEAATPSLEAA
ncbi:hypothetical protein GCM10010182_80850 [Actinomadura cremea]|nr:hypothetical protein GCM10010182_80850 [Actinomadura cremea]